MFHFWRILIKAAMLSLCVRISYAQSDSVPGVQIFPKYELPQSLPGYGVTSEEFERLTGLHSQVAPPQSVQTLQPATPKQPATPAQLPGNAIQPNLSVQVATPILTPSPFPAPNPPEPLPAWLQQAESNPSNEKAVPWWQGNCAKPILIQDARLTCEVELEQLVWHSMQYSPKVQSILILPRIQQTDIDAARGEFDRRRTANTNYRDNSDPVGNTLTTGGPNRLIEQFWDNSIGIKDRNMIGGKTELQQMFNARDSNSLFFKPNNQADTKLSLNYTQPLMRGAGRYYNTSSIRIAGIKTKQKFAGANRQLQNHARDVITTYWELVLQRYLLEQSRAGLSRLKAIQKHLMDRAGRDLVKPQLARARSAIKNQEGQIASAASTIFSLQESLRRLVNSPELSEQSCSEMIPLTMPSNELPMTALEDELLAALTSRGDILSIQETIEEAMVQRRLAVSELKPQLDMDMSSYIRGLQGDNQFSEAYRDQFANGRPSLAAGLTGSLPVGNRSAKANLRSRELEIAQLQFDYSDALMGARADIKSAIFNAQATYATTIAAIDGTFSALEEVKGQTDKLDVFFGENQSLSNTLNDLLDAEGRLISAENAWANRQIQHMLALMSIKYESGTLMTLNAE